MTIKKLFFRCVHCGKEVIVDEKFYSGMYDVVCNECEQEYIEQMNQQQEEFLRKEEPYLYE